MKLSELSNAERMFLLIKGSPKTGKSIAAHSYAALGPCYIFDLDTRMESTKEYYNRINRPDIIQNIDFNRFKSYFDIDQKMQELKIACPYKTVIVDSLTALARKCMTTMQDTRIPSDKNKSKIRGGIILSELEDFGGEANAITRLIDNAMYISITHNVHFILTAHVIDPEAGAFNAMRTLLTGGKKIAGEIPVYFNEVYHAYVQSEGGLIVGSGTKNKYIVATQSIGIDWASTTLGLPNVMDITGKVFSEEVMRVVKGIFNSLI